MVIRVRGKTLKISWLRADEGVQMNEMTMAVPQLHVGAGQYLNGVTLFPVWTAAPAARGLLTGAEAQVGASERAGSAEVGELVLENAGPRPALLLEGELLEGGMQHRTLVRDLILAERSSQVVEVACVEAGRWAGPLGHGRSARRASAGVLSGLRRERAERQQEVWGQVARFAAPMGASPTGSLLDHLDALPAAPCPAPLPGQRGVILGVGGRPLMLELFGSTRALRAHLPALLDSARLDAALVPAGHRGPVPGYRARDMAAYLADVHFDHQRAAAGVGVSVEAATSHAALRGICLDAGPLAHLAVLNTRHPLLVSA
jgi:hypothetical protein